MLSYLVLNFFLDFGGRSRLPSLQEGDILRGGNFNFMLPGASQVLKGRNDFTFADKLLQKNGRLFLPQDFSFFSGDFFHPRPYHKQLQSLPTIFENCQSPTLSSSFLANFSKKGQILPLFGNQEYFSLSLI